MYITSTHLIEAKTSTATQDALNILESNREHLGIIDDIDTVSFEGGTSCLVETREGTYLVTITTDSLATTPAIRISPVTDMEDKADGSESAEAYQLIVALMSTLA